MFLAFEMRMLLSLPTTVPIAKAIQLRKVGSSAWIHQTFRQLHNFSWQQGDGAFRGERLAVARNHSLHSKSGRTSSDLNFSTGVSGAPSQ